MHINSLCVIFTILVSLTRENALFASMAKINFGTTPFEKISKNVDFSLGEDRATNQNTFFDIFKHTYKKHIYGEKNETKIMKITHSAYVMHWLLTVCPSSC